MRETISTTQQAKPHQTEKGRVGPVQNIRDIENLIKNLEAKKAALLFKISQGVNTLGEEELDRIGLEVKLIRMKLRDLGYEKKQREIELEIEILSEDIWEIENLDNIEPKNLPVEENVPGDLEMAAAESAVAASLEEVEEENDTAIEESIITQVAKSKNKKLKEKLGEFLKKTAKGIRKDFRRKLIKFLLLPAGLVIAADSVASHTIPEYYSMRQNWKERHVSKYKTDDPSIEGMNALYNDSTNNIERVTYDYIGKHRINYKDGYYMSSVFDLTDRTPPQFKLINDRDFHTKIDSAAGITTNLFKKFYKYGDFKPELKGHQNKNPEEKGEIPVIGYNVKTRTMKAGHYREFNDDWMVSETYEIPLNFKLNNDGTVNLVYHDQAMRMVPQSINERGVPVPFPIGITYNKEIKKINPYEATRFGTLEGGKVIMVCGEKQLQVNGSFADMYRVYERLLKENPGSIVQAYLLDNGSYNLPIWNLNKDSVITPRQIKQHLTRNYDGGTALVLMSTGSISPYEYKNKYREIEHHIEGATPDSITGQPALNEKQVIVIHHTGNYADPLQIVREFNDPAKERSAHVLILKDGTRHLFNDDNSVLGHAGKSEFNHRNKVNYFSLGIEMEGDSQHGHQFTVAQLESMLEYIRPRVEKYGIPLENITTHKIIRNNYIKDHPEDKNVARKVDLDDKVWEQIRALIAKKIYKEPKKIGKLDIKGLQVVGSLTYQDALRTSRNKEQALNQVRVFLSDNGVPERNVTKTIGWITKKLV